MALILKGSNKSPNIKLKSDKSPKIKLKSTKQPKVKLKSNTVVNEGSSDFVAGAGIKIENGIISALLGDYLMFDEDNAITIESGLILNCGTSTEVI